MTQTNTSGDVSTKQADLSPDISLQPHQQAVVDKVQNQLDTKGKARMLLYHSLGSGKTLSGLAAADAAKIPYTAIVPAALRNNLRKEQEKFIDPATATPSSVMSHTAVGRGDPVENPSSILVDETHRFRNPDSAQAVNLMDAAEKAKQVVLLTGTPVVNSPSDFSVPYNILTGEKITPEEFSKKYVDETPSSPWYKRLFGSKPGEPEIINQDELKDKLKGKVDYFAPLAPKAEINRKDVVVEMNRDQTDLNSYMMGQLPAVLRWKLKMHYPLSQEEITKMTSFMTGLRQVGLSTLPFMKDKPDNYKAFQQSPKLTKAFSNLKELLDKDPNGKALIFSNFIDAGLSPYQEALTRAGIPAASFTGALSDKQRKKLVDDYNTDKLRVALLGPAGTEGLSFKGTKLVQLLDPHWNTTRGRQSEGRALRFDSHEHLPPEDRKVMIERYIARTAPGRLRSLLRNIGIKAEPEMATDDYLIESADRKQKLNEKFLELLKQIGSDGNGVEKRANPWVSAYKATQTTKPSTFGNLRSLWNAGNANPALKNTRHLVQAGIGGATGYKLNDMYLDQVAMPYSGPKYPGAKEDPNDKGVSQVGRLRSNLMSAILGAGLSASPTATLKGIANNRALSAAAAAGLTGRALVAMPQPVASGDPRDKRGPLDVMGGIGLGRYLDPGTSGVPDIVDKTRDAATMHRLVENIKGGPTVLGKEIPNMILDAAKDPNALNSTAKSFKEDTLPSLYRTAIDVLGGSTTDPSGRAIKPKISDVGTAIAPHIVGGLGGAYLGKKILGRVGDYLFEDNPDDDYERRKGQENRRWWLRFLGSGIGSIGGTMASVGAMPHINRAISNYLSPMSKKGSWGGFFKSLGTHGLAGAGITATQYGLGVVPKTSINDSGVLDKSKPPEQRSDMWQLGGMLLANTALSRAAKAPSLLTGKNTSPLVNSSLLAGGVAASPGAVNMASAVPGLFKAQRELLPHYDNIMNLYSLDKGPSKLVQGIREEIDRPEFKAKAKDYGNKLLETMNLNVGEETRNLLSSAGLAALAQGTGLMTGGAAGLLGGGWLADKVMGTNSKDKKRTATQEFIKDMASLAGAGVGAYAGLRGINQGAKLLGYGAK